MEYFVISAKLVPLKYYTLSSQLRRLTSFSVGCSGRQILSPGQIAVMRKWSIEILMVYFFFSFLFFFFFQFSLTICFRMHISLFKTVLTILKERKKHAQFWFVVLLSLKPGGPLNSWSVCDVHCFLFWGFI